MRLSRRLKTSRFWLAISPKVWFAIALLVLCVLCYFTPLRALFDEQFLVQQLQRWGYWAICIFVLVYTLATVLGVPGTVLTLVGSVVFGLVWGTFWSVVGATLGAIAAFWVARYLLRNWAEHRFRHHKALVRFNQAVMHRPLVFVLAVRFAPICPFNLVNFLFGLTPINWVDYAIGTFFGIIPGTLAYAWLGVTGKEALQGGDRLPFFLALSFLTLLSVLPLWATKSKT
jgi:uncharacterized membrane protein YdjX (TVP38/TMEM64 family)